jgi:hypothetical protein
MERYSISLDGKHAIYLRQVVSLRGIHHASWLGRLVLEEARLASGKLGSSTAEQGA